MYENSRNINYFAGALSQAEVESISIGESSLTVDIVQAFYPLLSLRQGDTFPCFFHPIPPPPQLHMFSSQHKFNRRANKN